MIKRVYWLVSRLDSKALCKKKTNKKLDQHNQKLTAVTIAGSLSGSSTINSLISFALKIMYSNRVSLGARYLSTLRSSVPYDLTVCSTFRRGVRV